MKTMRNIFCLGFIVLLSLSIVLPTSVAAATKPVISQNYKPGDGQDFYITKYGVLVNEVRTKSVSGKLETKITVLTTKGKTANYSQKGPEYYLRTAYGTNNKGKEVIYVIDLEAKTLKALNLSLKKIWQVKLKSSDYMFGVSKEDGSYQVSNTEKITIDGKRTKFTKANPAVKRVGNYEYRINERAQTYEKKEIKSGKVIWNKRVFDVKDASGKTDTPRFVNLATIDASGNVYATVVNNTGNNVVAVSNNGKVKWSTKGFTDPSRVVGDLLHYTPDTPQGDYYTEYRIVVANKNTGKKIKTYDSISSMNPDQFIYSGNNLYVIGENYADIISGSGKILMSYKSPKDREIRTHGFDNKNNFYIQSGYTPKSKDKKGWVFTYSDKGKLISKKNFDQEKYNNLLVNPNGKQHYQMRYTELKNYHHKLEFFKYN